jgi:S-adenosylmethionine decarboxylase
MCQESPVLRRPEPAELPGRTIFWHIMPGTEAASRPAQPRRPQAAAPKLLYAVDGRLTPASPVTDVTRLTGLATAAVAAGHGHVLDTSHVIFPNGAITLLLILAESHLAIHTWPEQQLIAVDLFSCGAIDGQAVISGLARRLRLDQVSVRVIPRGPEAGSALPA